MNQAVDEYISNARQWRQEMEQLRMILLDCGLTEHWKWSKPCYAFQNNNIVVIQGFKQYLAVLFFKGVLLKDPDEVLVKTGENTQVGRQIRFADLNDIIEKEPVLRAFVKEAVEVERAGLKVDALKNTSLEFPEEFQQKLDEIPALKKAFSALTPGRQRAYNIYFSAPKQSGTRASRIEKCIQQILDGKGLNDR